MRTVGAASIAPPLATGQISRGYWHKDFRQELAAHPRLAAFREFLNDFNIFRNKWNKKITNFKFDAESADCLSDEIYRHLP